MYLWCCWADKGGHLFFFCFVCRFLLTDWLPAQGKYNNIETGTFSLPLRFCWKRRKKVNNGGVCVYVYKYKKRLTCVCPVPRVCVWPHLISLEQKGNKKNPSETFHLGLFPNRLVVLFYIYFVWLLFYAFTIVPKVPPSIHSLEKCQLFFFFPFFMSLMWR